MKGTPEKPPALAEEPDLIERFKEDVELAGLVGEKQNAVAVLLCAASAKLPKPINLTVQGASAAGKNHLTGMVARFIPDEMKKVLTGMSPKALMHSAEDEFEHKAVFIAEYDGVARADYAIRTFQSEQVIEWEFVESSNRGIRKKSCRVRGPAAFIQTTTRPLLHPENETRLLFVQMDESKELTQEILQHQAREAAIGALPPEDVFKSWHELIRSLKLARVVIPFASQLVPHFPGEQVRSRRDFPKLLGLIEASAFLHQHQRDKEGDEVIADPKDYLTAKDIFEHAYSAGPEKAVYELLQTAQVLQAAKAEFTVAHLMERTGWGQTKTYGVLNRTLDLGCMVQGDVRGYFRLLSVSSPPPLKLPERVSDD